MNKKTNETISVIRLLSQRFLMISIIIFWTNGIGAYAQIDKKVSINVQNVSLESALDRLQKSVQMHFMYEVESIDLTKSVTLEYDNTALHYILDDLCDQTSLRYDVKDNIILIYPLTVRRTVANAEPIKVSGTVVDDRGLEMVGVNVYVPGTTNGVITDINGKYSIEVYPGNLLAFSFIGMLERTVLVKKDTKVLDVSMLQDVVDLGDVVVTGYQTLSKERTTGSFGIITSKSLEAKLQPDLKSLLEGQAAGVVLDKKGNIEIRGISSINAVKTPLLVVDSYPIEGTLEDLNPDNIESITVLKDGVAASIYGSRAANGVIVVVTKRGKEGKPQVSYRGSFSVVLKPQLKKLNLASSSDYIDAEIDLFNQNPAAYTQTSTSNLSRVSYLLRQAYNNIIPEEAAMAEIDQLRDINGLKQIEKHMFRNRLGQQHNLMIAGGGDKYNYNAAINYNNTQGSFLHTTDDRLIIDLNNQWELYKFLTVDFGTNIVYTRAENPTAVIQTRRLGVSTDYKELTNYSINGMLQPYTEIVDGNGKPINIWGISDYKTSVYESIPGMKDWSYNPINDLRKDMENSDVFKARISGKIRVNLLEGLNVEVGGIWQRGSHQYKHLRTADSYAMRIAYNDGTSLGNTTKHHWPEGAMINEERSITENWTVRTQINFNRSFDEDKHLITAILGNEVQRSQYDINVVESRLGYNEIAGSSSPMNMKDFLSGTYHTDMLFGRWGGELPYDVRNGANYYRDNRFVSWYGNGSYEYDNRFILSGSIRLDLTNFFGTDSKYRYKPLWSVGGTYKLSNEKFFDIPWVNRLHVRASYGINGNISLNEGPFLILAPEAYDDVTEGIPYGIASSPNNQLRWEKTKTSNIGLDLSFLDNALNLSVDYYSKNSSDLLSRAKLDPTTGLGGLTKNTGKITNRGIEVSLNATPVKTRDFRWNTNYNFAYNYNKVIENDIAINYTGHLTSYQSSAFIEGYPAYGVWAYRFAGLDDQGATMVYNKAGEKILIGSANVDDLFYAGTLRPNVDMAFTNAFTYKNWDLSFMFIAKLGHKYRKDSFSGSGYSNRHVGERWKKPGDEEFAMYPRLSFWNMDIFYYPFIDKLVADASYMKLRDVTLSYTFRQPLISKTYLTNTKVYFQMRNLFTITSKNSDIDPETAEVNEVGYTGPNISEAYTSLPLRPEFYVGVSFTF